MSSWWVKRLGVRRFAWAHLRERGKVEFFDDNRQPLHKRRYRSRLSAALVLRRMGYRRVLRGRSEDRYPPAGFCPGD